MRQYWLWIVSIIAIFSIAPISMSQEDGLSEREGHTASVNGALELANGNILSWSNDQTLILWDSEGHFLRRMEGHDDEIGYYFSQNHIIQLANGNILSIDDFDISPRLWDENGNLLATMSHHTKSVISAIQLSNNMVVMWSVDDDISFWDDNGKYLGDIVRDVDYNYSWIDKIVEISSARFIGWAFGSDDFWLWNFSGDLLATFRGARGATHDVQEMSDGRILTIHSDETIRIWQTDGKLDERMVYDGWEHPSFSLWGITQMGDNLLAWGTDGIELWSASGQYLRSFRRDFISPMTALVLADGRVFAWGEFRINLWDSNGVLLFSKNNFPNSRYYTTTQLDDGRLLIHKLRCPEIMNLELQVEHTLCGHIDTVEGTLELSNGHILTWSKDHTLRLWLPNGALLNVMGIPVAS